MHHAKPQTAPHRTAPCHSACPRPPPRSRLSGSKLAFNPYNFEQLQLILNSRLQVRGAGTRRQKGWGGGDKVNGEIGDRAGSGTFAVTWATLDSAVSKALELANLDF